MLPFSEKIIAFALAERSRGVQWQDIRDSIKRVFQIQPPSERQMRTWYKRYSGDSIEPERMVREAIIKATRRYIPVVAVGTQLKAVQQGIPVLLKALRRHRDPGVAGAIMILSTLEQMIGSQCYEKAMEKYERQRKITGWLNEPEE